MLRKSPPAGSGELYQSEEYSRWCDRMRVMFAAPFSIDEQHPTIYDRMHTHDFLSDDASSTVTPQMNDDPVAKPALTDVIQSTKSARFVDEDRFPFCFYARMLDSTRRGKNNDVAHNIDIQRLVTRGGSPAPDDHVRKRPGAHNDGDEAKTCARVVRQLRGKLSRAERQKHVQNYTHHVIGEYEVDTNCSSTSCPETNSQGSFCDAKVERIQAEIYDELTSLLLSVRRRNTAYAKLRMCQQQSHLVLSYPRAHE